MNIIKHMNIIVFSTYGYSLDTWKNSGTLKRELELYKTINKKHGVNFTFITYGNNKDLEYDIEIEGSKVVPIYSLIKYNKNRFIRYANSFIIPFKIKNLVKKSDILHQHQLLGSWIPIICKVIYRKKLLTRTGYDMYEFSKHQQKSILVKILYRILTKVTLFFSDIYTVTSLSDKSLFKEKEKIKLRPNWVYKTDLYDFDKRYSNRILSVGRLENQKNYRFFIEEFKNTKGDLIIDIYGSGQNLNNLKNLANDLNVDLNIYESLDHDKLKNIYLNYKYFITTSIYEGNPKTVLEAMSSGCVVLASNIPNHQELIQNRQNGYLFNLEDKKLINLYLEINKNQSNLKKVSKNAFKDISDKNSLELLSSTTYNDYLSLVR